MSKTISTNVSWQEELAKGFGILAIGTVLFGLSIFLLTTGPAGAFASILMIGGAVYLGDYFVMGVRKAGEALGLLSLKVIREAANAVNSVINVCKNAVNSVANVCKNGVNSAINVCKNGFRSFISLFSTKNKENHVSAKAATTNAAPNSLAKITAHLQTASSLAIHSEASLRSKNSTVKDLNSTPVIARIYNNIKQGFTRFFCSPMRNRNDQPAFNTSTATVVSTGYKKK